ncbi:hypothetical protein RJ641_026508 [Dillenia turbinata]|uniref:Uncharacterized protein n=1 Tax=Dillenia turbinata TaxID=194707 RepID=A0AAN8ZPJ8_9MAGN
MGRRDVYEEKLRSWNHHHDPTINPGLGSPRCPRCLSLLNPDSGKGEWTITSVLHDATAVVRFWVPAGEESSNMVSGFVDVVQKHLKILDGIVGANCPFSLLMDNADVVHKQAGSGIGAMLSAVHGFNTGIPFVQKHVKGPKWLPFLVGLQLLSAIFFFLFQLTLPPLLMLSAACAAFGGMDYSSF